MSSTPSPRPEPPDAAVPPASSPMQSLVRLYSRAVLVALALSPLAVLAYVQYWESAATLFYRPRLHEVAITAAVALGAFVSYVTWRCYRYSGEVFQRWLTLGLGGFTLLYLVHGALTFAAAWQPQLFLSYGIASRLWLMACLLVAALRYGIPAEPPRARDRRAFWIGGLGAMLMFGVVVALLAAGQDGVQQGPRLAAELLTLSAGCAALAVQLWRGVSSPLMAFYGLALALLAQASLAFLLSTPWNHTWWLAHILALAGFLLLSYGIALAFRTTGSFATVYSQEALMSQLRQANAELAARASTDSLTGARTRREFMRRAAEEMERARRYGTALSLLAMDVDRFKDINDVYGHQAGDRVLQAFVDVVADRLRPTDLIGRVGGEEFLVLLPETTLAEARTAAERMRNAVADCQVDCAGETVSVTVSIGVAELDRQTDTLDSWLSRADKRLYLAKHWGRNQVVSLGSPVAGDSNPPGAGD